MRVLRRLAVVELKLFAREPVAVLFAFALPVVVLAVLTGLYGDYPNANFGFAAPRDYYVAGYLAVVIACVGLVAIPVHVATYRERGILRRFSASSVSPAAVFGAQVIVGLVVVTVGGALLVAVGALAYGAALPASPGGAIAAFVLGSLAVLALGFLLAELTPTARSAQAAGLVVLLPMWLLSGTGPPRGAMPPAMRDISDALPLTHVVKALQDPWLGYGSSAQELGILIGVLAGATALAIGLGRRSAD
jgi:ABC-2 type transport system permease protein